MGCSMDKDLEKHANQASQSLKQIPMIAKVKQRQAGLKN
jgi:hypothetical protein